MEAKQLKLLVTLAKEIRTEKKDRNKVIASLQSAKILTKQKNFTGHYSHLKKLFDSSK